MKVHLNQIPNEGLHVEGTADSRILDLRENGIRPTSDVHYSLDVGISDGGLFATGVVGVELELECVSCLEPFRYALEVPDFACQIELTGSQTVDLTEPVREDILLALPAHPTCDWDGKTVCKANFTTAVSAPEPLEDRWKDLDNLKL